jgi:cytidine deaminase
MINSCHKFCSQCIVSYLHSARFKQPTCALCRDKITSLESNDTNILLLKNQFTFNESNSIN